MVFLEPRQAICHFFCLELCVITLLLQLICLLVHFNEQVLHPLQVSLFDVEPNLQRLTLLVDAFIFGLLERIELPQVPLLSLDLLLAQLIHCFA